jgi:hypothetical protein
MIGARYCLRIVGTRVGVEADQVLVRFLERDSR